MSSGTLARVVRFVIAGSLATATSATVLYVSITIFGVWYLAASAIGFLAGFLVSFTLQKFWTFRDRNTEDVTRQASIYLAILLVNLGLNTLIVFLLVEYVTFVPVLAQITASLLIACESFFVYQYLFSCRVSLTHMPERENDVS